MVIHIAWQTPNTILHVTTALASNEKTGASTIARISKKIDFLLCNSCFWCASYLNLRRSFGVIECPSCKENTIERLAFLQTTFTYFIIIE